MHCRAVLSILLVSAVARADRAALPQAMRTEPENAEALELKAKLR